MQKILLDPSNRAWGETVVHHHTTVTMKHETESWDS